MVGRPGAARPMTCAATRNVWSARYPVAKMENRNSFLLIVPNSNSFLILVPKSVELVAPVG
jgi:hypothetical protein